MATKATTKKATTKATTAKKTVKKVAEPIVIIPETEERAEEFPEITEAQKQQVINDAMVESESNTENAAKVGTSTSSVAEPDIQEPEKEVKQQPLISVLMTVKDTPEEWLQTALNSVLSQNFEGVVEVVLVDNGSKLELAEKIAALCQENDIKLVVCNEVGRANALNAGLELCRGVYVAKMDSDDIAEENWLRDMFEFMLMTPDAVVAGCQIRFFGEQNGRVTKHPLRQVAKDVLAYGPGYYWVTNHPGVFLKREEIIALGGYGRFDESKEEISEDFYLWCKVLKAGYAIYTNPSVLMNYRYSSKPERYSKRWYSFLEEQKNSLK